MARLEMGELGACVVVLVLLTGLVYTVWYCTGLANWVGLHGVVPNCISCSCNRVGESRYSSTRPPVQPSQQCPSPCSYTTIGDTAAEERCRTAHGADLAGTRAETQRDG